LNVGAFLPKRSKPVTLLVEKLLADVEIPLPQGVIDQEVHRHLEQENRLEDDTHRQEVIVSTEKSLKTQLLLDALVEKARGSGLAG
jgi:trigger factor